MAYAINTNIPGMFAHSYGVIYQRRENSTLQQLSSGLRINTAADDPSGMSVADGLRSQSTSLTQAVQNSNIAIGMMQTADSAMASQTKLVETIRVKATQAAQDGQSSQSRATIQNDIMKLMNELDKIASTTTFNGINLLAGGFKNQEFQVGAYANQTITATIGNTHSSSIGYVHYETTKTISSAGNTALMFSNPNGSTISLQAIPLSFSAGTGLGKLANTINASSDTTGVRATYNVMTTASGSVQAGNYQNLVINGISLGNITNVQSSDSNGALVNAINTASVQTGVYASIDIMGRLNLNSLDGRGINIQVGSGGNGFANPANLGIKMSSASATTLNNTNIGRLTLIGVGSKEITMSVPNGDPLQNVINSSASNVTLNLASVGNRLSSGSMLAVGAFANASLSGAAASWSTPGVTTLTGAMVTMDLAQSALTQLDLIRANIGSVVQQLTANLSNISTTTVNVNSAESSIRDTDFGAASTNFTKYNILSQAGSFVMAQSNQIQKDVLRLLQ